MILLNNILGGPGLNSRLNLGIREKYGFTYHIESHYTPYSDTGIFNIYLASERDKLQKCIKLVKKELRKLRDQPLGPQQLKSPSSNLSDKSQLDKKVDKHDVIAWKVCFLYNKVILLMK